MRSVFSIGLLATLLVVSASASFAQTKAPSPSRAGAALAPGAPVNINTASAAELDALPGIGAKTAALIVEYRQKNGPFVASSDSPVFNIQFLLYWKAACLPTLFHSRNFPCGFSSICHLSPN